MTRLLSLPAQKPTYEANPEREALMGELRALRAALSLCAARMGPTRASIEREVERIRRLCDVAEELAGRL